ncbi:MAG: DUF7919 family protein [Phycisphaerae bacterium]
MAHYLDLTPYAYLSGGAVALNIGWLSAGQPYTKGQVPSAAIESLRELVVTKPFNQTRGFHPCELCEAAIASGGITACWGGTSRKLGSAEIRVVSQAGVTYAAPDLVIHYIEAHGYMPPDEFMQALLAKSATTVAGAREVITLTESVFAVADHPGQRNHDAFCAMFLRSRVGARIPKGSGSLLPGTRITTAADSFSLPTGTSLGGEAVVVVTADIPEITKRDTGGSFLELDARDVVKMAIGRNAGIVVQALSAGRQAWAGISKEEVIQLNGRR